MSCDEGLHSSCPSSELPLPSSGFPSVQSPLPVPPVPAVPAPSLPANRNFGTSYGASMYRPYQPSQRGYFGSYGSPLGYGYQPYGYSGYGSFGTNAVDGSDSRFIRMAEESSRPTFQAIETLVRTVNSISLMMESTYSALHTSFGAVLNVVESFSNFGVFLKRLVQSVLAFRVVQKFLVIVYAFLKNLGLINSASFKNFVHQQEKTQNIHFASPNQQGSVWPFFTFLGLMVAVPYLLSKMVPSPSETTADDPKEELIAVHDFQSRSPNELSVTRGERLCIIPNNIPSPGWVLVRKNGDQSLGYVPKNHLARINKKPDGAIIA